MASMGLPIPMLGYLIAIAIEIDGSLLLLVGFQVRIAAFVMFCFTIATALIFHRDLSDQSQMINFLKNLGIAGGLLQVVAFGGGSFSVDARVHHRVVSKEPAPPKIAFNYDHPTDLTISSVIFLASPNSIIVLSR
jgi:putative oxidoreductase